MWNEMQHDWENFSIKSNQAIRSVDEKNQPELNLNTQQLTDEKIDYTGNNKTIQSQARIGQNFFRKAVLSAYNYRCCITGLSIPSLLVASHIIPWREMNQDKMESSFLLSITSIVQKA